MSKVINKKLHPYYKTGIYGWIGEEVDDNDYIICPICGDVLGVNYCDYSAEQGYYNKCPKCKQELDYSEIYDFEDTCYFEQLLEIKESRLADLEAKLAEKEAEIEELKEQFDMFTLKNAFKYQNCMEKSKMEFAIDYAVEQLEKVKELLLSKAIQITGTSVDTVRLYSINEIFNNKIKQLKEMK